MLGIGLPQANVRPLTMFGCTVLEHDFGSSFKPFVHLTIWQYAEEKISTRFSQPIHSLMIHLAT
jgi:hypothetical protein